MPNTQPSNRRFFYGWLILAVATLAQVFTAPGQTVGVSEFKDRLAEQLEINDRTLAIYYCYGTALGSFALPVFGYLIDRVGCRFAMMSVSLLFGATCFLAGRVSNSIELLLVFTFLRMLGQGALSLVASTMVSLWFKRRLAFAYSLMSVGTGAGMMFVPYVFKPLFESFDLLIGFQIISLAIFLLVPLAWFLIVDRPGLLGCSQDGDPSVEANGLQADSPKTVEKPLNPSDFTFGQAIRTRAFWIVTAAQAAWALIGTGLVFNRKDILMALQTEEALIDLAVPALFGAVILGQILTGWFARRFSHASLFSVGCLGMSGACGLILLQSSRLALAGFAIFGLAQGIFIVMGQSLWADFYGRSHIGRIRGLVWMIVVLASSLGGFALTLDKDSSRPFQPIEYSMVVMALLSCCCWWIHQPTHRAQ